MKDVLIKYISEIYFGFHEDLFHSEAEILSFLSVLFFCICCTQMIQTMTRPIPILVSDRPYARKAHQLEKFYKTLSWGIMSFVFLVGLVMSFYQVFTAL